MITLLLYFKPPGFFTSEKGSKEILVVDKDNQYPDPMKMLIWGRNHKGEEIPGDFAMYMQKVRVKGIGDKVTISYHPEQGMTYDQIKGQRASIIKQWISEHEGLLKDAQDQFRKEML